MISPDPSALLAWYDRHRRVLPWRAPPGVTPDPYAVWLSEVMLQQTTVAAVKPYYEGFLARWPRVGDLAAAPVDEVMRAWAGLGYYSRARNLHACAKAVTTGHGGRFPAEEADLRALPGIGPYTAAAISAIAFGHRAVVVDGNVERVVSRLFAIETPMPAAKPLLRAAADRLTPERRAGDFAQGMMDLGATVCSPRRPACGICPYLGVCLAAQRGEVERFPVKASKAVRPHRRGAVFFVHRADGAVLVQTRPPKGLLGGMSEFPGSAWAQDFDLQGALAAAPFETQWTPLEDPVEHVFTHFALTLTVLVGAVPENTVPPAGARFVDQDELAGEAFPSVMQKVLKLALRGTRTNRQCPSVTDLQLHAPRKRRAARGPLPR